MSSARTGSPTTSPARTRAASSACSSECGGPRSEDRGEAERRLALEEGAARRLDQAVRTAARTHADELRIGVHGREITARAEGEREVVADRHAHAAAEAARKLGLGIRATARHVETGGADRERGIRHQPVVVGVEHRATELVVLDLD